MRRTGRHRMLAAAAWVVAGLAAGPACADDGTTRPREVLGNLIRWYVHEEQPARREELLEAVERLARNRPEPVLEAIRSGAHLRRAAEPALERGGAAPVFVEGEGRVRTLAGSAGDYATLELPRGYTPERAWPLLLDLGPARFSLPPDAVVLRVMPPLHPQAREHVWAAEALVLSMLAHAVELVAIDPERVVVRAQDDHAALAWYVALHHPDRFAGLLTSDGAWAGADRLAVNAAWLTALAFEPRRGDGALRRLFDDLEGERHRLLRLPRNPREDERFRPVIDGFRAAASRARPGGEIRLAQDRGTRLRAFWLQAAPRGNSQRRQALHPRLQGRVVRSLNNVATIHARVDPETPNLVHVDTRHVTSFDLFLEPGRFDANLPLRVSIDGGVPESKLIVYDIATLLEDYRARRDPGLLYACKLTFPVRR